MPTVHGFAALVDGGQGIRNAHPIELDDNSRSRRCIEIRLRLAANADLYAYPGR